MMTDQNTNERNWKIGDRVMPIGDDVEGTITAVYGNYVDVQLDNSQQVQPFFSDLRHPWHWKDFGLVVVDGHYRLVDSEPSPTEQAGLTDRTITQDLHAA